MSEIYNSTIQPARQTTRVSVLICTRNRAESLRAVLEEWTNIKSSLTWEIVIVDNGSTDHTKDVIESYYDKFDNILKYAYEPKKGLSRARNCAIENSIGEFIIFTDDDCFPDQGIIENSVLALQCDNLDYVGGMITLYDQRDAHITIKVDREKYIFQKYIYIQPGVIHGACFAFRRKVFDSIGKFNVYLGAGTFIGSGEDAEIICRASMHGFVGGYNPIFSVKHNHGRREKKQIQNLLKYYDRGRGAIYSCMLIEYQNVMLNYIKIKYFNQSPLDTIKNLYWISLERFPKRIWNVSVGFIVASMRYFVGK